MTRCDGDAAVGEPGDGAVEEPDGGGAAFVGEDLDVGEAGGVIDATWTAPSRLSGVGGRARGR